MSRTSIWIVVCAAAGLAASPALAQNAANGTAANGAANGTAANGAGAGGANGNGGAHANNQGGALITISSSGVRQIQQVLNRLGYFAGPVNGMWDRESADAMAHFQEAHGLEPTGNVNFSTIAGLGLWNNLIGDPLGNHHQALTASNAGTSGAPPMRGNGKMKVAGEPLPSQRVTTTGGNALGSNTNLPGQPTGNGNGNGGGAGGGAGAASK